MNGEDPNGDFVTSTLVRLVRLAREPKRSTTPNQRNHSIISTSLIYGQTLCSGHSESLVEHDMTGQFIQGY